MIIHDEYSQTAAALEIANLDMSVKWELKLSKYKESKTREQLNLYWKWVGIIGDHFGEHKDDMSEYLKQELIQPEFVIVKGKARSIRPSVSRMKVDQMAKYMDKVSIWAGQQGLNLPHPEDTHAKT